MGTDLTLLDLLNDEPAPSRRGQPKTAHEAAVAVTGKTGTQKRAVLLALYAAGEHGLTDYDASVRCGIARPHAAATRRKALERAGLVKDSGRERATDSGRNAAVWVLTDLGRDLASKLARTW